jgi:hypothetical protein
MSGSSSIPRSTTPITQPSVNTAADASSTTTAGAVSSTTSGTTDTQVRPGINSRNLATRQGTSFSSSSGASDPDLQDRNAFRRKKQQAHSVFGMAGAMSRPGPRVRSNPGADTESTTSGDSEHIDPPGHGGPPYATHAPNDGLGPMQSLHLHGREPDEGAYELKQPPALKAFLTLTEGKRPPGTSRSGGSRFNTQSGQGSTTTSTSTSLNPAQPSQEIAHRMRRQQSQQQMDEAGSTSSSGTVPGIGKISTATSATAPDSSLHKTTPLPPEATEPVEFTDDFPWALEGETYRLAEFDKWLQIPAAREAINNMLIKQKSKDVIQFLELCDNCAEAQRKESRLQLETPPEARRVRVPETYTATLKLVKSCFADEGKAEITIHGADVRPVLEAWKSVKPNEGLTWSGPMSTAVRKIRTCVITMMVMPFITGFTGRETLAQIKAAVDADNKLRAAQEDRSALMAAVRGHKKSPKPGPKS